MSLFTILPPSPVPRMPLRLMPCCSASFRANGEILVRSSSSCFGAAFSIGLVCACTFLGSGFGVAGAGVEAFASLASSFLGASLLAGCSLLAALSASF